MTKEGILEYQEVKSMRTELDVHIIDHPSLPVFYKLNMMTKTKLVTPSDT